MHKTLPKALGTAVGAVAEASRINPPRASVDAPHLPETGFLRQWQVLAFVPISKSTLWRRVHEGTFPGPVKLSVRVTVWRAEDLRHWIDSAAAEPMHLPARTPPGGGPLAGGKRRAIPEGGLPRRDWRTLYRSLD